MDKIRVLLIDDNPEGLPRPTTENAPDVPVMASRFQKEFEFRWLATPQECREYRDLSWVVAQHDPTFLHEIGWVPDVLVIDYALTQYTQTVADRVAHEPAYLQNLSPLTSLRKFASALVPAPDNDTKPFGFPPPAGSEYWGCFIGGLILNTFSDYPCAPVTITKYTQDDLKTNAIDAAFFEWLMETQSSNKLRANGRGVSPGWEDILLEGMSHFRHRLRVLAKASVIHIGLDDLLALTEINHHPVLSVASRYGRRRYPVAGIFLGGKEKPSEWAMGVLKEAWEAHEETNKAVFEKTVEQIRHGKALANVLWEAYSKNGASGQEGQETRSLEKVRPFTMRQRLSELEHRGDKCTPAESEELNQLKNFFGVSGKKTKKCTANCVELRQPGYSDEERRWAVLFIVLRLLHLRHSAVLAIKSAYGGKGSDSDFCEPLSVSDVFLALFPIPTVPVVLPWHNQEHPSNSWNNVLTGKVSPGLNLQEFLEGGDRDSTTPSERLILRMYAESLGASSEDWGLEDWKSNPQLSHVLFGTEGNT